MGTGVVMIGEFDILMEDILLLVGITTSLN
jgi:hypothetical protein